MLRSSTALAGLTLAAGFAVTSLAAQERAVVEKEVSVGRAEASLRLEFDDGQRLEIALREGSVEIDDRVLGSFEPGDALDAAFRDLAARAVSLDDGPLAEMLREWAPPSELEGHQLRMASDIDRSLEEALEPRAPAADQGASLRIDETDERALMRLILGQAGRLELLQRSLGDLSDRAVDVHLDEDVDVEAGQTVDGTLVVVGGDVRVSGTVTGDLIVVDGTVDLLEGGHVEGNVNLVDARMATNVGTVGGRVTDLLEDVVEVRVEADREREIRERIREEVRSEIRNEIRRSSDGDGGWAVFRPFRATVQAVGGILENLLLVLLLGAVGVGVSAFAGQNLDVVAETARRAPGRAAMVGFAGSFLLVPVWVLGTVALAVSIVGIPVLLAWVPLFPVAAMAAGVLGFLAVARNLGEWLADSDYRYTDWIRKANPVYTIFGGLLALLSVFMLANALRIVPFLGAVRGLLSFAGVVAILVASQIGFGAVLLTRAGRKPEYYPMDPDEAWRRAVEVDVDDLETGGVGAEPDAPDAPRSGGPGGPGTPGGA